MIAHRPAVRLFNFWINWFTSVPSRLNGDVEIWQEHRVPLTIHGEPRREPGVCVGLEYSSRRANGFKMITSINLFRRWTRYCAAFLLCASLSNGFVLAAQAGELDDRRAAAIDTPEAVSHGEFVFHGNYCGLGNRAGAKPVDALDVACMHHDACTPSGKIQSCACNARLVEEANAVAHDPAQTAALQSLATLTAAAATAGLGLCTTAKDGLPEEKTKVFPSAINPVDTLEPITEGTSDTLEALPNAPNPQGTVEAPRAQ